MTVPLVVRTKVTPTDNRRSWLPPKCGAGAPTGCVRLPVASTDGTSSAWPQQNIAFGIAGGQIEGILNAGPIVGLTAVGKYANTYAVALGDVDGDGDLDAVLGSVGSSTSNCAEATSYQGRGRTCKNQLLINDGKGGFTVASSSGIETEQTTRAVALADIDGDNDLDLMVAVSGGADLLFRNDGTGTFTAVSGSGITTTTTSTSSAGLCFGDIDSVRRELCFEPRRRGALGHRPRRACCCFS